MCSKCQFAEVYLHLPDGWVDTTHELPPGSPHTLVREGGFGALQFTVGICKPGVQPNMTRTELERLLCHFEDAQNFGRKEKGVAFEEGKSFGISCDYHHEAQFVRVWYVTNGMDIAFITYLSDQLNPLCEDELGEATAIAESVEFARSRQNNVQ